jgi:hypothetical protein
MDAKSIRQQPAKLLEKRWTRNLQEEAKNWQLAKADDRYQTDQGVPVVHLHKRSVAKRSTAARGSV